MNFYKKAAILASLAFVVANANAAINSGKETESDTTAPLTININKYPIIAGLPQNFRTVRFLSTFVPQYAKEISQMKKGEEKKVAINTMEEYLLELFNLQKDASIALTIDEKDELANAIKEARKYF
ncbi:MAG TPA: hypothetical protein VHO47_00335 [Candidatus Babeliales bacterium]|nr:hypothetical protein [Candidatus Babeliales bacterium]